MKTSLMLLSLLVAMPSFAAIDIPSFKAIGFSMSHATEKSSHRWAVSIAAPEKHHFNLQAPMSAVITPKSSGIEVKFSVDQKTENKILFGIMNASITPSDNATVIAYLCDDAKTYCVKKQELVPLSSVSPSAVDLGVLPSQK